MEYSSFRYKNGKMYKFLIRKCLNETIKQELDKKFHMSLRIFNPVSIQNLWNYRYICYLVFQIFPYTPIILKIYFQKCKLSIILDHFIS